MALDFLESIFTSGASDWATAMSVASQLPGRIDGPNAEFEIVNLTPTDELIYMNDFKVFS